MYITYLPLFYTAKIYNIYAFEMSQYDFWMKF
jgi:hypothetical protein